MILFQSYYVSQLETATSSEEAFFTQVQRAISDAFYAKERGMSVQDWSNSFKYVSKSEVFRTLKKSVNTPSVIIAYRNSDKEPFKYAFLKGIGNVAAWKIAAQKIFDGVPMPQTETGSGADGKNGGGKDGAEDGTGTGKGGSGWGNGKGFGVRPCIPILDNILESLGLGKVRQIAYGVGAAALGYKAIQSESKILGAGAIGLAYLAATMPDKPCTNAK